MKSLLIKGAWVLAAIGLAASLGILALNRGETVNAAWMVIAAICTYTLGYRFYSGYIANKVLCLDDSRPTPAIRNNDGLDYVPTNTVVLFGHQFAAIAGAGPLVGPVLAAQMGYLPGILWILAGAVFAGCVQDFLVMAFSMRRNGSSLSQMIKDELGKDAGVIAQIGIFMISTILIAVLGLVVTKALIGSPWGAFAVIMTIPISLFMGVYMRYLRPGRILEVSVIGIVLLLASLIGGANVAADPVWGPMFTFSGPQIAIGLSVFGVVAAILPVWLMLAPRDYLSTFMKIGVIVLLAGGILFVLPEIQFPAMTRFIDGTGPSFAGSLFPFLFITIACSAISGFHAIISSGTTPKMVERESDTRILGYGAMVAESFVGVMALVAATCLDPGTYFALNAPAALIGTTVESASAAISNWGFVITPESLAETAKNVGETSILSRSGGAPTLAVGMAHILSQMMGGKEMMAFWYHFAILFEALFILTTISAGTRVARFMLQDIFSYFSPSLGRTNSWTGNALGTGIAVACWGYILYQGVVDPFGGINSLWALFGISNQMLAAIALTTVTVLIARSPQAKAYWVGLVPLTWLLVCSMTAGVQKIWHSDPAIGFLAHARMVQAGIDADTVLAPAKSIAQMEQIVFNDYMDATLCVIFGLVVIAMLGFGLRAVMRGRSTPALQEARA